MEVNQDHYCSVLLAGSLSEADKARLAGQKAALLLSTKWNVGDVIKIRFLGGSPALQFACSAIGIAVYAGIAPIPTIPYAADAAIPFSPFREASRSSSSFLPSSPPPPEAAVKQVDAEMLRLATACPRRPKPSATRLRSPPSPATTS